MSLFHVILSEECFYGYDDFAKVLDDLADQIEEEPEDLAQREKSYSPIHKASPIAYPTWKCSKCGAEDRFKKGDYCKMCGRKFVE